MGIFLHALIAAAMAVVWKFHPYPWTTFVFVSILGWRGEQQYLHGQNKIIEIWNAALTRQLDPPIGIRPLRSSFTLDWSAHKWAEALAWGLGAGLVHLIFWLVETLG